MYVFVCVCVGVCVCTGCSGNWTAHDGCQGQEERETTCTSLSNPILYLSARSSTASPFLTPYKSLAMVSVPYTSLVHCTSVHRLSALWGPEKLVF